VACRPKNKGDKSTKKHRRNNYSHNLRDASSNNVAWIEKLLQSPIKDHRKFVVWLILPQYLINTKRLSYEEALGIVKEWLDRCNNLERLDSIGTKQR
jgi:hypothetical protein